MEPHPRSIGAVIGAQLPAVRSVPGHMEPEEFSMPTTARSTSGNTVRARRSRLRKTGLRPVQIWVPDVRSKAFARAAHRQSLAVAT